MDIKVKETESRTIKALNRSVAAAQHTKEAAIKTKEKAERSISSEKNPEEYAADRLNGCIEHGFQEAAHQFDMKGRKATNDAISNAKTVLAQRKDEFPCEQAKKTAEKAQKTAHSIRSSSFTSAPAQMGRSDTKAVNQLYTPIRTKGNASNRIKQTTRSISNTKRFIKTGEQAAWAAQTSAKATLKTTEHTAQVTKFSVKTAVAAAKQTAQTTLRCVKLAIAGTKALVSALLAGSWVAVTIILLTVMLGIAVSLFGGKSNNSSYIPVNTEVEAYTPLIRVYAKQYNIDDYVELIKAVMMQESGGHGLDPMQASESEYNTRYSNTPNAITDPEYSIQVGIQTLAACLSQSEVQNPLDMDNIKLALQGYNYGNRFISWAQANYGGYSLAAAIAYSNDMSQQLGRERYGDKQYVSHVLRYYPYGRAFYENKNTDIVEVALSQVGNVGGEPYWSWYGFESRVEWCACFVSWCAEQCGYLTFPKFALCTDGVAWFKANGQWQERDYQPSAGDIIFFDWDTDSGQDSSADHVGIVERVENGIVYTVEGNSGDVCRKNQYEVGYYEVLGYGVLT